MATYPFKNKRPLIAKREIKKIWDAYQKGASLASLGRERGITSEAVGYLLHTRGFPIMLEKRCALFECGKPFKTNRVRQETCCPTHHKLHDSRKANGLKADRFPCAMPECSNEVVRTYAGKRPQASGHGRCRVYCCKAHSIIMQARRAHGWYRNLLCSDKKCANPDCGETIVLDEHHIEYSKKGSNKKSKTVWLCPTHHMAIHRGYAKFAGGKFVDTTKWIVEQVKIKAQMLDRYKEYLIGDNWAAAKG